MPNYHRAYRPGATCFFTVNLEHRDDNDLLTRHIDVLRSTVRRVRERHPFEIHAWVVLPDHMHCVIELPDGDDGFANRWRLIKAGFSRALPDVEGRKESRRTRGERGIWQRRFWEHLVQDDDDYRAHIDYVHINPLKHGLVPSVADWPYSTFHRCVVNGIYPRDWGGDGAALNHGLDYPD